MSSCLKGLLARCLRKTSKCEDHLGQYFAAWLLVSYTGESTLQDQMAWQYWAHKSGRYCLVHQVVLPWQPWERLTARTNVEETKVQTPHAALRRRSHIWLIKTWLFCRHSFGAWILAVPLCLVAIVYKYVTVSTRQTIRHWSPSITALKISKNWRYARFNPVSLHLQWKF